MDKLKLETPDLTAANVQKLQELFPGVVNDGQVNFDLLRSLLGDAVAGDEAYEFTWVGKRAAIAEAGTPIRKTLRPCPEESKDWDNTENIYIEGDNLDALKLLQESYLGKVKMIYIDPPYNTGNDFVYKDNYAQSRDDYDEDAGVYNEDGDKLFRNTLSNGRFHSDWCSMMYPRLVLARNLLREDGVIFISIDENEFASLKHICNEIFGESNFVAEIVWSAGMKNDSKYISISHEYILVYFKDIYFISSNNVIWREKKRGLDDIYNKYDEIKSSCEDYATMSKKLKAWYKSLREGDPAKEHSHYSSIDGNGIFLPSDISWPGGGGQKYEVLHPKTKKPVKIPARGWLTNETTMRDWIEKGIVEFGENEDSVPTLKLYLKDHEFAVPYSVLYKDGRAASKRLKKLFGEKIFENPKDEQIISKIIEYCGLSDGDIILDFFAGSSTTAHAVINTNFENCKKIKYILVQCQQIIDINKCKSDKTKKVAKNALAFLDSLGLAHNICEIGKERIRRTGEKIKAEIEAANAQLTLEGSAKAVPDIGFRVFKVDSTNMKDVYYNPAETNQGSLTDLISNIKDDRNDLDLLFGCLLDWALPLSCPHTSEEVDGATIHIYKGGELVDLVACFADNISETVVRAMAGHKPLRAVFRDACFADAPGKINVQEISKSLSPATTIRVL